MNLLPLLVGCWMAQRVCSLGTAPPSLSDQYTDDEWAEGYCYPTEMRLLQFSRSSNCSLDHKLLAPGYGLAPDIIVLHEERAQPLAQSSICTFKPVFHLTPRTFYLPLWFWTTCPVVACQQPWYRSPCLSSVQSRPVVTGFQTPFLCPCWSGLMFVTKCTCQLMHPGAQHTHLSLQLSLPQAHRNHNPCSP